MESPAIDDLVATRLAEDYGLEAALVKSILTLLDAGTPVPYLARYRREEVGGLGEAELHGMRDAAASIREFEQRREFVVRAVAERDVPEKLKKRIVNCSRPLELEYLYEPYRPPRKTPGSIARERGLEPLAEAFLRNEEPAIDGFVDAERGVGSADLAVQGAREILAERFAMDTDVRTAMLRAVEKNGTVETRPAPGKNEIPGRFAQFKSFSQKLPGIPPQRMLTLLRAEADGALALDVTAPDEKVKEAIARRFYPQEPADPVRGFLDQAAAEALRYLRPAIVRDAMSVARTRADEAAVAAVSGSLRDTLLFPPAGPQRVMGVDPSPRGSVPVACIDDRGTPLAHARLKFFGKDEAKTAATRAKLAELVRTHDIALVALGNGQGRRECEGVLLDAFAELGEKMPPIVIVNESGAGAYASGPVGRADLPALPVPARAAVSIARRLIDPLAELVKADARQLCGHNQGAIDDSLFGRKLDGIVESCVGHVGVDVNRAGPSLLSRVCGLSPSVARQIVEHREKNGLFPDIAAVQALPFVTDRAFEWAGGFLRVNGGENPLDATGVHPAHYGLAAKIAQAVGVTVEELVRDSGNLGDKLDQVVAEEIADESHGPATVAAVIYEILVGGADPRPALEIARRDPGVRTADDLEPGMKLSGRVTNVTNFGAFVDVGVRQDGLVHVSELADRFVRDPAEVVSSGKVVEVRVLGVDRDTGRISLSMRSSDSPRRGHGGGRGEGGRGEGGRGREGGGREGGDRGRGGRDGGDRRRGRGGPRRDRRPRGDEPRPSVPEPQGPPPLIPELPENPIPDDMTEEEFMKQKMEELKRRFS